MSSGSGYAYQANDSASMAKIYDTILEKITVNTGGCDPVEAAPRGAPYARIKLTQPQNPTWSKEVTADANGIYNFTQLKSGLYTLTVVPAYQFTSVDGKSRTYSRVINARNPNEEEKASVDINAKRPDGATFVNGLDLYIGTDQNGAPKNGCSP